jgi:hypothetical protein
VALSAALAVAEGEGGRPQAAHAIEMMFFLPGYPLWALVIIAADVIALWGLCAYGSRASLDAG